VTDPIVSAGYRGLAPESLVIGGVAQVSQAFADLGDLGYSHVLVRHLADDQRQVLESYQRLGAVACDLARR